MAYKSYKTKKTAVLQIRMEDDLKEKIDYLAMQQDLTLSFILRELLEGYVQKRICVLCEKIATDEKEVAGGRVVCGKCRKGVKR